MKTEFVQQQKGVAREVASVVELKQRVTVDIQNLDLLTLKDEVEKAVQKLFPDTEKDKKG